MVMVTSVLQKKGDLIPRRGIKVFNKVILCGHMKLGSFNSCQRRKVLWATGDVYVQEEMK